MSSSHSQIQKALLTEKIIIFRKEVTVAVLRKDVSLSISVF
jgi:hypothetical protein